MKKIFIINSRKFVCSLFSKALKEENTELYTLTSIEDALHVVKDFAPDIFLFDLDLYGQSTAKDFCAEVKQALKDSHVVYLAMGTKEQWQSIEKEEHIFQNIFYKPFSPIGLRDQLKLLIP